MIIGLVCTWIVVLALCWLGWQLLRQNGRLLLRLEALEQRLGELSGPPEPEGLPVGTLAPEFDLPDLTGERRTLAQFRAQPVLLIFFNPDCGYCRDLAPKLAGLLRVRRQVERDAALAGLMVTAPSDQSAVKAGAVQNNASPSSNGYPLPLIITTGDAEKNRQFFQEHKITSPVLLQENGEVATAYQANGTPTGYLINAEGKIASELAMGAGALLALANGPGSSRREEALTEKSETQNLKSGIDESLVTSAATSRFGNRALARSKIARNGLKAGIPAPGFHLPRLGGGELALEELRGSRVLLVFSDPHCGPCDALAPKLESFHRSSLAANDPSWRQVGRAVPCPPPPADLPPCGTQGTARPTIGIAVVMISRGEPKENRAKVKQHGLTFPVVLQQQWEISQRYAMFATPIAYLIDEAGVIARDVAVGEVAILKLLAEANSPKAVTDHRVVALGG